MALSLVPAGAGVIALGYTLAPHAKMDQIVAEIRRGVLAALQLAYKRNSRGVFLSGHSAGAHLTAMALADDELRNQPHLGNLIKGVVFVSGIYDLRPLVNTDINDTVQMTTDDAWRNSPINCIEPISENCRGASVLVTLGQHDPPMFHEQSTQFNQELEDRGVQVKYLVVQNTDHFNVMDQLQDPNHAVTKEVKHMMGLH